MTLRGATLDRAGKLADEQELDELTCSCCQTDALRLADRTLFAYRDRDASEVRDIGVVTHSRAGWSPPQTVHADGWTIAGCPVNGPALAGQGARYAAFWPTMASNEMQLKLALADYKRVLIQRPADLDAKWNYELALEKEKQGGGGGGGGGQSNASEAPAQNEPKPQPTLAQRQAEQLLGSAEREEREVQSKKQKQNRPEPPPGGKDW
jgi:hypothetical protein